MAGTCVSGRAAPRVDGGGLRPAGRGAGILARSAGESPRPRRPRAGADALRAQPRTVGCRRSGFLARGRGQGLILTDEGRDPGPAAGRARRRPEPAGPARLRADRGDHAGGGRARGGAGRAPSRCPGPPATSWAASRRAGPAASRASRRVRYPEVRARAWTWCSAAPARDSWSTTSCWRRASTRPPWGWSSRARRRWRSSRRAARCCGLPGGSAAAPAAAGGLPGGRARPARAGGRALRSGGTDGTLGFDVGAHDRGAPAGDRSDAGLLHLPGRQSARRRLRRRRRRRRQRLRHRLHRLGQLSRRGRPRSRHGGGVGSSSSPS